MSENNQQQKYAIRFGLGAIKAVGLGMMEVAVEERKANGKFKDVYDFSSRLDPKSVNKKSIEALAKSGAFDCITNNRRQIFESFEVLSNYAAEKKEEATSNQMSLFGGLASANTRPELKKVEDWTKEERLQKEFEAFGFFLNEHPLDDHLDGLRKRGVIFSDKIEKDELEDNCLIKMAGVVAGSKHRSSARGRFAYIYISDPFGIFEAMIFDEAIITNARDILLDGSVIALECLVKKDDGGVRILVREVLKLEDFLKNVQPRKEVFEDIVKQKPRKPRREGDEGGEKRDWNRPENKNAQFAAKPKSEQPSDLHKLRMEKLEAKQNYNEIKIYIKEREPVLTTKIVLSQMLAPHGFAKKTKVVFVIEQDVKSSAIELPGAYLIDEADASRLRGIPKVLKVETN